LGTFARRRNGAFSFVITGVERNEKEIYQIFRRRRFIGGRGDEKARTTNVAKTIEPVKLSIPADERFRIGTIRGEEKISANVSVRTKR
jgi:hypothetical protein